MNNRTVNIIIVSMLNCEGEKGLVTLGGSNHLLRRLSPIIMQKEKSGCVSGLPSQKQTMSDY